MLKKIYFIIICLPLLGFLASCSDDDAEGPRLYTAEVSVAGVEEAADASTFKLTGENVNYTFTEADFANNTLSTELADLEGTVELTLSTTGLYTIAQSKATVSMENKNAAFTVEKVVVPAAPATVSPESADFNLLAPADVQTTITFNDATAVESISVDGTAIPASAYSVDGTTLTINQEYLEGLNATEGQSIVFNIAFDEGADAPFTVNVVSNEPLGTGILTNYNFENNLEGWTAAEGDGSWYSVIAGGPTNGKVLFYEGGNQINNEGDVKEIWNNFSGVEAGATYKLTVSADIIGLEGGANMKLRFFGENGFVGESFVDFTATDGFQRFVLEMEAPAGATRGDAFFALFNNQTGVEIYIDEVVVTKVQ